MQGVTFDKKHSYWDWNLMLKEAPVVSPPKPKTKLIDIPGIDGSLDLSEALTGKIHYEMRNITCTFFLMCDRERWPSLYTEILNHLHGKKVEIVLDNDPEYIYTGRAEISSWTPGQHVAEVVIKAKVAPYKVSRYDNGKKVL